MVFLSWSLLYILLCFTLHHHLMPDIMLFQSLHHWPQNCQIRIGEDQRLIAVHQGSCALFCLTWLPFPQEQHKSTCIYCPKPSPLVPLTKEMLILMQYQYNCCYDNLPAWDICGWLGSISGSWGWIDSGCKASMVTLSSSAWWNCYENRTVGRSHHIWLTWGGIWLARPTCLQNLIQ